MMGFRGFFGTRLLATVGTLTALTGICCGGAAPTGRPTPYARVPPPFVGDNVVPVPRDTTLVGGLLQNVNLGTLPFLLVERALVAADQRALAVTVAPGA